MPVIAEYGILTGVVYTGGPISIPGLTPGSKIVGVWISKSRPSPPVARTQISVEQIHTTAVTIDWVAMVPIPGTGTTEALKGTRSGLLDNAKVPALSGAPVPASGIGTIDIRGAASDFLRSDIGGAAVVLALIEKT